MSLHNLSMAKRNVLVCGLLAALIVGSLPLEAQLRGGRRQPVRRSSGISSWWVSGGAGVAGVGLVRDGASGSEWDFSGDPRWQYRASLEKTMQATTTLGVAVNLGTVDLAYRPLTGAEVPAQVAEEAASVRACRVSGCTGMVDLYGVQLVARGGNAREGLYQIVEATGGITGFRNMRVKSDSELLPVAEARDLNASIGYGFGFALSPTFHVAFVQDFGLAWHSGDNLPDGAGRTYRTRNSRVTVRYGLGDWRR